jgi:ketosteroid isomerase-like protein
MKSEKRNALLAVLALLLLALACGCGSGGDHGSADGRNARAGSGARAGAVIQAKADIRAVLDAQADAWNRGDLEGYMQGYWKSDSVRFVTSRGISRGWQAMLDRYRRGYPDAASMGRLRFEDVVVDIAGDSAASVFGCWRLTRRSDAPWGYFTLLLRRTADGWRIVHDHTSSAQE